MSPKPEKLNIAMDEVLAEIDQRPFIQTLTEIVLEVSPGVDIKHISTVIKQAVRCACLLDLYAETCEHTYKIELEKQRTNFYKEIPKGFSSELEKVENDVKRFFDDEKILMRKIKLGDKFSENDIRAYLLGKSGDNLFYGKLLELVVPEWDLTKELQIQTMLFDIGKDLVDYKDDIANGLPNILIMCLSSGIERSKILQLSQELKTEALTSPNITASPTLVKSIEYNCNFILDHT